MLRKDLEEIKKDVGMVLQLGKETDMKVEILIEAKLVEIVALKVISEVEDKLRVRREDVAEKVEV